MTGLLAPLKNKTISCSPKALFYGYAMVDASGNPYTRVMNTVGSDSGWVPGYYASYAAGTFASWNIPLLTVTTGTYTCTAVWPLN